MVFSFLGLKIWLSIKKEKNGRNGILYLTKAPKFDVLKPIPNPRMKVNNKQKMRKGSLRKVVNSFNGLVRITQILNNNIITFSIPEMSIVGESTSHI